MPSQQVCFLEAVHIAQAVLDTVVIRIYNAWLESQHPLGSLIHAHGVGQVHANERKVDAFEGAHFGNVFGVAGKLNDYGLTQFKNCLPIIKVLQKKQKLL